MLCMLEWMRKGKRRIGTPRTQGFTWFNLDGLHPLRNPLRGYIFIMYKSVVQ